MTAWDTAREAATTAGFVGRTVVVSVTQNWGIALVSLAIAFGVWFVVTDVENPRVQSLYPPQEDAPLRVSFVNVADGFVVEQSPSVRLSIEARQDELDQLGADDFQVRVDMQGAAAGGVVTRPVEVVAERAGLRVLSVEPPEVSVTLTPVAEREVRVVVRRTGDLPDGFSVVGTPEIDPPFVTVTGLPQLVESVDHAEVRVNLTGVRTDPFPHEGRIVPVTESGNEVALNVSDATATVTFRIQQTSLERTFLLEPRVEGTPAAGHRIADITAEPATVDLAGSSSVLAGLDNPIQLERVDVSGATSDVVVQRAVPGFPDVTSPVASVTVHVTIAPITCGAGDDPCDAATLIVAPRFTDVPPGLTLGGTTYRVPVRLAGPITELAAISQSDVIATVSLAGGRAGTASYPVEVALDSERFPGIQVLGPDQLDVVLGPAAPTTQVGTP